MSNKNLEFIELSKEILKQGRTLRFQARGGSMYPFIRDADTIQVKPVEASKIHYADIIFYHDAGGKAVVHRVIKKRKENGRVMLLAKGDSSSDPDAYVNAENILGKVVGIERGGVSVKIEDGLFGLANIIYARFLPLSKWPYLLIVKSVSVATAKKDLLNENKLIAMLCRPALDSRATVYIKNLLQNSLEWGYISRRFDEERITSLAYCHLKNLGFTNYIPEDALERFENTYRGNSVRNTVLLDQAKRIIQALNAEKIQTIALKGCFLLENVYKNIALRPVDDLDILVKKEDLSRVDAVLNSLSFVTPLNYRDSLGSQCICSINSLLYECKGPLKFFLHLHWHLINSTWPLDSLVRKIDMERLWANASLLKIGGADTFALTPEHFLIYLSQHALGHSFERLIVCSDIAEVIDRYRDMLDWDFLKEEAGRFGLSFIVYQALLFTSQTLGIKIPQLALLKPDRYALFEKLSASFIRKGVRSYKLSYLVYFSMQRGIFNRLRFISNTLFPSPRVLAHSLNLPVSEIRPLHYYQRFAGNLLGAFIYCRRP